MSDPAAQPGAGGDPEELTAGGSLPATWRDHAAREPDRPCLHDSVAGWISRGRLAEAGAEVAGRLYAAGLRRGDRVLLSAPAGVALVAAHTACLRMGLVVVPLNAALRRREVAHIVADASPRGAILDDPEMQSWVRQDAPEAVLCTSAVDLRPGNAPSLDDLDGDEPAMLGYTSGTTGTPKGAVLTHGNLLAGAESLRRAWGWSGSDRLVLALPLFHMHGLGVGLHGTLHCGASAILQPSFDADAVIDAVREHRATLFFGVPTMYNRLAGNPRAPELAALRLAVSGSAPLPAELHRRLEETTGLRTLERYGMTETVMLVSNPLDGDRRPGSVGFPLPGVELRLLGVGQSPGSAPEVPTDAPGEIWVRGPNVFAGYWRRPGTGPRTDGWFCTGDVGRRDADGYLYLEGRRGEVIITGGFNVYPREVEEQLADHPQITEVVVAGRPDEEWGEIVTAYVVPAPGRRAPTAGELRSHVAERLAPYKYPRAVVPVEAIPRNALGKVQRHLLGEVASTEAAAT
ncbi:MAG: AMP-binding protein [Acidimicrobiia bacterium]|nr:AMP-binding protein [Acidimicrobiia bacterium]